MMTLVAERTLAELGMIGGVLSGEVPRSDLTPMPSLDESDHRTKVALSLIGRLGNMLARVRGVAGEMEGVIEALAGPNRKLMMPPAPPDEEPVEKPVFGFASARRAA